MRLCTFLRSGAPRLGVVTDDGVVDLGAAAPGLPDEMTELLASGPAALRRAASAAAHARERLPLDAVQRTGTPGGVGIAMKPPKLLVVGDVVRVEIEGLGRLENPIVDEPAGTAVSRAEGATR